MALEKLVIGLTGNIASGKSTVSEHLKLFGANVIDADYVVHEIYAKNIILRYRLVREFGLHVLKKDLKVDRKYLGRIVFNDRDKMSRLQDIVWPYVNKEIKKNVQHSKGIIVLESALLLESRLKDEVDYIVFVACEEELRIKRLIQREYMKGNELTLKEAKSRIESQVPQEKKVSLADYVIQNNSTKINLMVDTKNLWNKLIQL